MVRFSGVEEVRVGSSSVSMISVEGVGAEVFAARAARRVAFESGASRIRVQGGEAPLMLSLGGRVLVAPFLAPLVAAEARSSGCRVEGEPVRVGGGELRLLVALRGYQVEAVEAWRSQGGRGIVVMPTGAGKTVVAAAASATCACRKLVLAPTRELVRQWIERIPRMIEGVSSCEAGGGCDYEVATYAWAARNYGSLVNSDYCMVVFDEVHHLPAPGAATAAYHLPAPLRIGLTATLERSDGAVGYAVALVGPVAYRASVLDVAPFVSTPMVVAIVPPLTREGARREEEHRRRVVEYLRAGRIKLAEAEKMKLLRLYATDDYPVAVGAAIAGAAYESGRRVIVTCESVRSAERIHAALTSMGVRAVLVKGSTPQSEREEAVRLVREEGYMLVATTVADEGLDVPDLDTVVSVGLITTKVMTRAMQRLGRVMRPKRVKPIGFFVSARDTVVQVRRAAREAGGDIVVVYAQSTGGPVEALEYAYRLLSGVDEKLAEVTLRAAEWCSRLISLLQPPRGP